MEQIAWQCGFEHSSYFYRLFQRSYGMAPGHYRKRFSRVR
ncbi:MAG: helix-turn-helix domain-containing protein [Puniceicoccaceae bacterium]